MPWKVHKLPPSTGRHISDARRRWISNTRLRRCSNAFRRRRGPADRNHSRGDSGGPEGGEYGLLRVVPSGRSHTALLLRETNCGGLLVLCFFAWARFAV